MAVFNIENGCSFLFTYLKDSIFKAKHGFLVNTHKKLSLQKFWFPVFWNEKGIGCNSRTVPATVNRNTSFCKKPLFNNGKGQNAKVRRPARIITKNILLSEEK